MAYRFGGQPWYEEVARTSTSEEYQTARIRIEDPSLVTQDYDIDTGVWTYSGDPVIYPVAQESGQARVIGVRWGVESGGESQANATTLSAIRVQIPRGAVSRVKRGCKVFVQSAPNPVLQGYVFTVTSDMQGASDAARTFECMLDIDSIRAVTAGTVPITGTPEEGEILTITPTGWGPGDVSFGYQWFRSIPPVAPATDPTIDTISGATNATFTIPSGWTGSSVFASVTGSSPWFSPVTVQTAEVEILG